jgi:hypothetical protein
VFCKGARAGGSEAYVGAEGEGWIESTVSSLLGKSSLPIQNERAKGLHLRIGKLTAEALDKLSRHAIAKSTAVSAVECCRV